MESCLRAHWTSWSSSFQGFRQEYFPALSGDSRDSTWDPLYESDLKQFKDKLSVFPFKEGYVSIPKGLLEEANLWELTELLLTYCAEDYSVEVVSEVLKAIECEPLPEWLFQTKTVKFPFFLSFLAGPLFPNSSNVHFIERHREALIQRTIPVEPVLDSLHDSVLSEEQYQKITAKETNPDKMRELYKLVPSWDLQCKNKLYEALKAKNPHLVKDLEGQ
uniref:CARD domain-containing protein n=1 Tax=Podarcis muralis TaxID=64176 RepID=A0A670JKP9_PODMU